MVNLKKIGAIATGALFVGATMGAAAAINFNSNMLVSSGSAKAKLVTGTANPNAAGLAADEASAGVINDAVEAKFTTTSGGANVQFKYDDENIDDTDTTINGVILDGDGDDVSKNVTSDNWDEKWMVTEISNLATVAGITDGNNLSTNFPPFQQDFTNYSNKYGIWFDADGDGDIESSDDWPIYNDIFIVDRTINDLTIRPAMRIGNMSVLDNEIFELKGQEYWVKGIDLTGDDLDLVPVSKETLISSDETQDMLDAALLIPGTDIKIGMQELTDDNALVSAKFAIIEGGVVTEFEFRDNETTDPLFVTGEDQELLSDFFIVPVNIDTANGFAELAIGKKTDEFTVADGDKNVLGYAKAEVNEDGDGIVNEFRLEDDDIQIARDSSVQLANTDTYAKYTDDKEFDLVRKKLKSAASGSDLDSGKTPWDDFLSQDVTVSITGGTTGAVSLSTVKDTGVTSSDKTGYNLVLVGGPVANVLTADLVSSGKSTVDWFTSTGEVEVVESAFSSGKYAIIAAGEDRDATEDAATALAAMV